jgi:uncharacterized caspase-like protein
MPNCLALFMALLAAALGSLSSTELNAQNRVALVIGNDRYPNLPADRQLQKAVNDARGMSEALQRLGFNVIRGENLGRIQMVDSIVRFTRTIKPGDIALVFFAGHGVSLSGANYLLPADIPLPSQGEEIRVRNMALGESDVAADIQAAKPRVLIMVLDACRDNPFRQAGLTRSVGNQAGLSRSREAEGVFTIYSAGFGQAALDRLGDGDRSPNSVFTRVLIPALARTDAHLADIVIDMREEVARLAATINHEQYPAYYDQTRGGRLYLAGRPAAADAVRPDARPSAVEPRASRQLDKRSSGRRVALLIANSDYLTHTKLRTPGNDIEAVGRLLRDAKFDNIAIHGDLDRAAMRQALSRFAVDAAHADIAVVYYSGHSARVHADRFLFGVEMKVRSRTDIILNGLKLNDVIDATTGAGMRLIVIDGDQGDAFADPAARSSPTAERIDPRGAVLIYSSGPNEAAQDGTGAVSPFTDAFVRHFRTPGLGFADAFARVRRDVAADTKKAQNPILYGSVPATYSLLNP